MKKEINYIVRYDDNQVINTIYCETDYQMQDLIKLLDRLDYGYVVIKISSKDKKLYSTKSLLRFDDLFEKEV